MFRSIDDFLEAYGYQRDGTLKYLRVLTDASLAQQVADGYWNLGQLAWHIATTVPEMTARTGIKVASLSHDAPRPQDAAAILEAYEAVTGELMEAVTAGWDDATLAVEDDMYGMQWKRGMTLAVLINHEIHHRGQMSVLMRQAGLTVPGIYGPAKEEWAELGTPPPEI